MIYAFLGLLLLAAVGTGGGYWHGLDVGEQRYAAKLEAAQKKVQEQADQLKDTALQKQAEIVAAFDKGRADVQEKTKIVYVKGAQYVANDKALSSPQCVMGADQLQFANAARTDLSTAAAAVAALGLSGYGEDTRPVIRNPVQANPAGRSAVPAVPPESSRLRGADEVSGNNLSVHRKPSPIN